MSVKEEINTAFAQLLGKFNAGISNTSTVKYDPIKKIFGAHFGIPDSQIYATGTTSKRVSNLDTRYAQGNQRGQHAQLALAFIKIETGDGSGDRGTRIKNFRDRAWNTSRKFVTGEERGTTFDCIVLLVQFENEETLVPAGMLAVKGWGTAAAISQSLDIDPTGIEYLERLKASHVSERPARTYGGPAAALVRDVLAPDMAAAFQQSLLAAGIQVPSGFAVQVLASLIAKRFLVFQGLSGSGKSKIALAVGKWFQEIEGQTELVAVGADWTSNEHILGYQDSLDSTRYRRPVTGALDVILAAKADASRPYFLILDEMNLSHVERYFADLLSAIESQEPLSLHSADEEIEGVPPRVLLPLNLYVIGTVNVDDTTYSFSPKVLDRANVVEFKVDSAGMNEYLVRSKATNLSSLAGAGAPFASAFVDAGKAEVNFDSLPASVTGGADVAGPMNRSLMSLFEILQPFGWEFGYRVGNEVQRFIFWHAVLTGPGWNLDGALDAQVVQKIMPKLHGSEYRLRAPLESLLAYAQERRLARSETKIRRMLERLRDGFTSFAEA